MEKLDAYKIIDEYMGYEINRDCLNSLVLVWEKLENGIQVIFGDSYGWDQCSVKTISMLRQAYSNGKTIQEAACIATAKAIMELKND